MVIGLVGCGIWGSRILEDLVALGCRVLVAEQDPDRRAGAETHGAAHAVAGLADLPALDGVVIATPASTHAGIAELALERGVPVLVEKPLTVDVPSAERLAARSEGRLFVGHVWRYHPGIEALAGIVRNGELGAALALHSQRANWGSPRLGDADPTWTLLPHDLSIALAILGHIPEPRAAVVERIGNRPQGMVALLGERPFAHLEVSIRVPEKVRRLRLHCEGGIARLDGMEDGVIEIRKEGAEAIERRAVSAEPALRRELAAFLAHVGGGPVPPTGAGEGLLVVEAVSRLRRLAGV